jgi:hypothetical protein
VPEGDTFAWDPDSTYIRRAPYFDGVPAEPGPVGDIAGARVLCLLGDSITTDHISPAGSIRKTSLAGQYLVAHGVEPKDFNQYGTRRGNHEVMVRGTFANVRLRNRLAPDTEGPYTIHLPSGDPLTIYDASARYAAEGVPLIVLAGKEYGSGSSRDWAAKGPRLLGVRAVIAQSYERIHRSNLVGMGILPLSSPAAPRRRRAWGSTASKTYATRPRSRVPTASRWPAGDGAGAKDDGRAIDSAPCPPRHAAGDRGTTTATASCSRPPPAPRELIRPSRARADLRHRRHRLPARPLPHRRRRPRSARLARPAAGSTPSPRVASSRATSPTASMREDVGRRLVSTPPISLAGPRDGWRRSTWGSENVASLAAARRATPISGLPAPTSAAARTTAPRDEVSRPAAVPHRYATKHGASRRSAVIRAARVSPSIRA